MIDGLHVIDQLSQRFAFCKDDYYLSQCRGKRPVARGPFCVARQGFYDFGR